MDSPPLSYDDGGETALPLDDIIDADDEGEADEFTPQEIVAKLKQLWRNEKEAPELLQHRYDIVDCVLDQLSNMQANIRATTKRHELSVRAHTVETDRIRYMLTSYIRARVDKIERLGHSIVGTPMENRMGNEEKILAKSLIELHARHMDSTVLSHLPPTVRNVNWAAIGATANMQHFVFARIGSETIQSALVDTSLAPEQHVSLPANSQHILPYSAIAKYVDGLQDRDDQLMHNVTLL